MFSWFFQKNQAKKVNTRSFESVFDALSIDAKSYNSYCPKIARLIYQIFSKEKDETGQALVQLCLAIFEKMGLVAINNDGFFDQKKDILLYQTREDLRAGRIFAAVQCKSYSPQTNQQRIREREVSSFMGHTENEGLERIYITSSFYNADVIKDFSSQVRLIDRLGLMQLLFLYFPLEMANVLNSFSFCNDYSPQDFHKILKHFCKQEGKSLEISLQSLEEFVKHSEKAKEFSPTCPQCKLGKLQRLYSQRYHYFWHKCMACQTVYYLQGHNENCLKKKRKDPY